MRKVLRIFLVVATMLFLYRILASLFNPPQIEYSVVISIRKWAWIVGAVVAAVPVFIEDKLNLVSPKPALCERCIRRDKAVTIILTIIAVVHVLSAFLMPNIAEIFSPIFLAAALLEQTDFLRSSFDFLNQKLFMLESRYYFIFYGFLIQQIIFSGVCYVLFGKLCRKWHARQLQTAEG